MGREPGNARLSKIQKRRPHRSGALILTKRGVYMVRGDHKLKNIQLISWETLLDAPRPSSSD